MDLADNKNLDVTTGIVYPAVKDIYHYISDLEEILKHHCNFVIYPITEEDIELHQKSLAEIFDVSQKTGLTVFAHPCGIGHVFDGSATSRFVVEHRDSWQVLSTFQPVPATCMNNLEFKAFMQHWIDQVVALGADGIAWDNPHYYIHEKKSQIWIQNFKLLAGEEKQVVKAIDICMNEKIDSIVGWSYYGSRAISSQRCQNPKVVWDILGNMFERFNVNNSLA
jgi:hypothetical protein